MLYFNSGSLTSDHHVSVVEEDDDDRDVTVDKGGQIDETKQSYTVM